MLIDSMDECIDVFWAMTLRLFVWCYQIIFFEGNDVGHK